MTSDSIHSVDQLIFERTDARIHMLKELVRVPSDNPPGDCEAHAERAAELLTELGFEVERHPVPKDILEEAGLKRVTNLIVRHRFGEGPTIALNAHGDVVPPGDGWHTDPYSGEIHDGWLYGRGAAVSKSDFVTYADALRALIDADLPLCGSVELHLTYDEETGGQAGPQWMLQNGVTRPDYAVCAAFSYKVITAHNGCLHLEVELQGRSAHAAWAETGLDALEAATHLLKKLYAHRDALRERRSAFSGVDHPSLVVGTIQGGINTNVVPDRISIRIDRRIIPEEDGACVESELTSVILDALADYPQIGVDIRRVLLAIPFTPTPAAEALAGHFMEAASEVLGEPVQAGAVPLYTDARHYAEAGVPTVMYGAGPRDPLSANGHRADERVPLDTLTSSTRVIARVVMALLADKRN